MKRLRVVSVILVFALLLTMFPYQTIAGNKGKGWSLSLFSAGSGTYTFYPQYADDKEPDDIEGYTFVSKTKDKNGKNERVEAEREKDGVYTATLSELPEEYNIEVKAKTFDYKVNSISNKDGKYILNLARKFKFTFKGEGGNKVSDGEAKIGNVPLKKEEEAFVAYLTKEEQKNKTITVNFKNYYDKYEVESFNSASKEIKLHKYDFYLKENEKADVATLLNGISYNSANISKTENLDKGDGYVIGKKKGSAYVTLNYKTKDAEGNEISKSVTRYIYVYKPLEFELSGYYQGKGTKTQPYIVGEWDNSLFVSKNEVSLPNIKEGNPNWSQGEIEIDDPDNAIAGKFLLNTYENKLVKNGDVNDVCIKYRQKDGSQEVGDTIRFYFRFVTVKQLEEDTSFTKKEPVYMGINFQKLFRQGATNTNNTYYFLKDASDSEYATVDSGEKNQAIAGTINPQKVTEKDKTVTVIAFRNYDGGFVEQSEYRFTILKQKVKPFEFMENEVKIKADNNDKKNGCAYYQKLNEPEKYADNIKSTYKFEVYDESESEYKEVTDQLVLSSREKVTKEDGATYYRNVNSSDTGKIYGINETGRYRVTAERAETELYEAAKAEYELYIERIPIPIPIGEKGIGFNEVGPIMASYGGSSVTNKITGYKYPNGIEPKIEYWIDPDDADYGEVNSETGEFKPSDDITLKKNKIVTIYGQCKEVGIYAASKVFSYQVKLTYMEVKDNMFWKVDTEKWHTSIINVTAKPGYKIKTSEEAAKSSYDENAHDSISVSQRGINKHIFWIYPWAEGVARTPGELALTLKYDPDAPTIYVTECNKDSDLSKKKDENDYNYAAKHNSIGTVYLNSNSKIKYTAKDVLRDDGKNIVKNPDNIALSGLSKAEYLIMDSSNVKLQSELEDMDGWVELDGKDLSVKNLDTSLDEYIIYFKVTDLAGNVSYSSTDKIVRDDGCPSLTFAKKYSNNILDEKEAVIKFNISDDVSGLDKVKCKINGESKEIKDNGKRAAFRYSVDLSGYDENNISIVVEAIDKAGNKRTKNISNVSVDKTRPRATLTYDNNSPVNGEYYTETRTAVITVLERNFSPEKVSVSITSEDGAVCPTYNSKSGWVTNSDTTGNDTEHVYRLHFNNDGKFKIVVSGADKADNKFSSIKDSFIIDTTHPEVSVDCDNNNVANDKFYKDSRTFGFDIKEHNFEKGNVNFTSEGQNSGLGNWQERGKDEYYASVTFSEEGKYSWKLDVKDKAQQKSSTLSEEEFIIDKTLPVLEVTGVDSQVAYTDEKVNFSVNASDEYFDKLEISLTYLKLGKSGFNTITIPCNPVAGDKGASFTSDNLPEDGVYTLICSATDKAGNESKKEILFSINRNGSTFYISEDTRKLTENCYVQKVTKPIVISEVNVNPIKEHSVMVNGKALEESANEYKANKSGGKGKWNEVSYVINESNFSAEGDYSVVICSTDENGTNAYSDIKDNKIEFVVDQTEPRIIIAGIESDKTYKADKKDIEIMPLDEGGKLKSCSVIVRDKDGKDLIDRFDMQGDKLLEYLDKNEGKIKLSIPSGEGIEVVVEAKDCAIAEDGSVHSKEEQVSGVIISTNIFDIIISDKPLLYASAGGFGGVIFIIFAVCFLFRRRKAK